MNSKTFQLMYYGLRLALFPTCKVSARLPLAQASIESANFTSNIFKSLNNMFGMMQPAGRAAAGLTRSVGPSANGFATFASPFDAIWDYLMWLKVMGLNDDAALDRHLASGKYAADPRYYAKVNAKANEQAPLLIDPAKFVLGAIAGTAGVVTLGVIAHKALK